MSDTANETKLRQMLERLANAYCLSGRGELDKAIAAARKVLAETEPKHPAELLFEEWWVNHSRGWVVKDEVRKTAMRFYRAGLNEARTLVASHGFACTDSTKCDICRRSKVIQDAMAKVPQ